MSIEHKLTENEFKEIWERLAVGEESIKVAHKRIDTLEKLAESVNKMAISINDIATETRALREDYIKADEKIEELKDKPIKRYETFVTASISSVATGVVGYIIGMLIH